ncbi:hypothetical protein ABZ807_05625 [Micromonospora sp. NPDC047548]
MWAGIVQGVREAAPEVGGLLFMAALVALLAELDRYRTGAR